MSSTFMIPGLGGSVTDDTLCMNRVFVSHLTLLSRIVSTTIIFYHGTSAKEMC